MTLKDLLFALIRYEITGREPSDAAKNALRNEETVRRIAELANFHDLAHLVADALFRLSLLSDETPTGEEIGKYQMLAIYRRQTQINELTEISEIFRREKIPFVPLKGSVLCRYYPEGWMRTSCDIDVLVRREDLDRAVAALVSAGDYRAEDGVQYHDISLYSRNGFHLELHHSIMQSLPKLDALLDHVWDFCTPVGADGYEYQLSPSFFAFYHVAHMATHFSVGGCGIRPVIDLWILRRREAYPEAEVAKFCEEASIGKFYACACELSDLWMEEIPPRDEVVRDVERYVFEGGTYGTDERRASIGAARKGGKIGFVFSRLFWPYEMLVPMYPVLKKHKWMLPICQVRRLVNRLRAGKFRSAVGEIRTTSGVTKEQKEAVARLLDRVGL